LDAIAGMQAFNAVVEAGGFAAAATRLGLSRALVSKRIAALERSLGARLFARTTRRVAMTEAGAAFHRRATGILANFEEARAELHELQAEPRGTLKVNAPMSFGTLHLAPLIGPFLAQCPGLSIELVLNDRVTDLLAEGVDVAIRIGSLRDSSLVVRRLAATRHVLCAAPAYLKRHGTPRQPSDLAVHRCLHYGYLAGGPRWRFTGPQGPASVAIRPALTANNGEVLRVAARDGQGIVLSPDFIVAGDLTAGRLVALMPGWRPPESAVHALRPAGVTMTAKVRRFIDFLAERLARPAWQVDA
jgi:DNA-binding transcriptional LysR family regulator